MQRPANHIFSHCKVIFYAILMIFGRNVALYVIFVFAKWLEAALNIFAVIWEKHFGGMPQIPGSLPGTSFTSSLSMKIFFCAENCSSIMFLCT